MTTNQTKQNAPYGYYELGLRADMLEVELKAACAACTHLDEKLKEAEAKLQAVETDRDEWLEVSRDWRTRAESAEAAVRAVRDLLRKPGCWSEWARECLAVISGGGK
ncbi:MAG TPA: hypothetical protein VGK73_15045 [Polyangiaceae bacterium]